MAKMNPTEWALLEDVFMDGGYVLDFSNPSMREFFECHVGINIEDSKYGGESKAKRLRAFLRLEPGGLVGKLINMLLEHKLATSTEDRVKILRCQDLVLRLRTQGLVSVGPLVLEEGSKYIEEHIEKCNAKMSDQDFSGAITNARSLVETVLLALEKELYTEETDHKGDLKSQYKHVARKLNLDAGMSELSTPLRQILTGLTSIVSGLAALRSKAGDAHGRLARTHEHHARIAVNSAGTLADFLLSTYKYQRTLAARTRTSGLSTAPT